MISIDTDESLKERHVKGYPGPDKEKFRDDTISVHHLIFRQAVALGIGVIDQDAELFQTVPVEEMFTIAAITQLESAKVVFGPPIEKFKIRYYAPVPPDLVVVRRTYIGLVL